jgi:hypothetical protein
MALSMFFRWISAGQRYLTATGTRFRAGQFDDFGERSDTVDGRLEERSITAMKVSENPSYFRHMMSNPSNF